MCIFSLHGLYLWQDTIFLTFSLTRKGIKQHIKLQQVQGDVPTSINLILFAIKAFVFLRIKIKKSLSEQAWRVLVKSQAAGEKREFEKQLLYVDGH